MRLRLGLPFARRASAAMALRVPTCGLSELMSSLSRKNIFKDMLSCVIMAASFFILRCTKKVADWAIASAADLTFASVIPRVLRANVKSKTALDS